MRLLYIFMCLFALSNEARSDIYMYTDEAGTKSFSNVPTDERYVLTLRTEKVYAQDNTVPQEGKSGMGIQHQKFSNQIRRAATDYHLDASLLHAVIATESGFNVNAVSKKGAMGLMQLMPETAQRFGAINPFDPEQNIRAGAQYLNTLIFRFNNDLHLALAAYNSGEANVVKYGRRIPPFPETEVYVPKVMGLYRKYSVKSGNVYSRQVATSES